MLNKLNILILLFLLIFAPVVCADEIYSQPSANSATSFQNIQYDDCSKMYNIAQEQLFYLTLGAINANKFSIDEVQSNNGYIIFAAGKHKYLATVAKIDESSSILKITPCNNVYNFPPGIITNTFKYIDLNLSTKI